VKGREWKSTGGLREDQGGKAKRRRAWEDQRRTERGLREGRRRRRVREDQGRTERGLREGIRRRRVKEDQGRTKGRQREEQGTYRKINEPILVLVQGLHKFVNLVVGEGHVVGSQHRHELVVPDPGN
jgi:hypothetical protein